MKVSLTILTLTLFSFTKAFGEMRTWTSSAGTTLKAELAESVGNKLVLRTAEGRLVPLNIDQLSKADQQVVINWKSQQSSSLANSKTLPTSKLKQGLAQMLPAQILDSKGQKVSRDKLAGKTVGFYFSAHWCPPCRKFTPQLVKFRDSNQENFEVVFISGDRSPKDQMKYMKTTNMKWYTLPLRSKEANALSRKYNVRGIPSLVIVDPDGKTLTTKGTTEVMRDAKGALQKWTKSKAK